MAKLNFIADPTFVPAKAAYDLIPTGEYVVKVIESEVKATSKGQALNLTFVIAEGDYRNRRLWVMLNLQHPDESVVGRAYSELQALCKAVGVQGDLNDTEALHDKPLTARVYQTRPKDGYESKNSARMFKSVNHLYPPGQEPAPAQPLTPTEKARALIAKRKAQQMAEADPPF